MSYLNFRKPGCLISSLGTRLRIFRIAHFDQFCLEILENIFFQFLEGRVGELDDKKINIHTEWAHNTHKKNSKKWGKKFFFKKKINFIYEICFSGPLSKKNQKKKQKKERILFNKKWEKKVWILEKSIICHSYWSFFSDGAMDPFSFECPAARRSREAARARETASQIPPMKMAQKRFSIGANGSVTWRMTADSLKYTKNPTMTWKMRSWKFFFFNFTLHWIFHEIFFLLENWK